MPLTNQQIKDKIYVHIQSSPCGQTIGSIWGLFSKEVNDGLTPTLALSELIKERKVRYGSFFYVATK